MPKQVIQFKLLIASPGDVSAIRDRVMNELRAWNELVGMVIGVSVLPIRWERHCPPGVGAEPQDVVNQAVLADADLVLALFGMRLGTPTRRHASGTVEEIRLAIEARKEVMIYFLRDEQMAAAEPHERVRIADFRTEIQQIALTRSYSDDDALLAFIRDDITLKIASLLSKAAAPAAAIRPASTAPPQWASRVGSSVAEWQVEKASANPSVRRLQAVLAEIAKGLFEAADSWPEPSAVVARALARDAARWAKEPGTYDSVGAILREGADVVDRARLIARHPIPMSPSDDLREETRRDRLLD